MNSLFPLRRKICRFSLDKQSKILSAEKNGQEMFIKMCWFRDNQIVIDDGLTENSIKLEAEVMYVHKKMKELIRIKKGA